MSKRRSVWLPERVSAMSARGRLACVCGATALASLIAACGRLERPATAPASSAAAALPPAKAVRFVRLEEVTEWNGHEWALVAEFNLLDATGAVIDRKGWVATVDSAAANDRAENAIDGDPNTFWHTQWDGVAPPPPHALTVDLGALQPVTGFRYLGRQGKVVNGTIAKYRFYVSTDGLNWGEPGASGDFSGMSAPSVEKTVVFATQTPNHPPVVTPPGAQHTPMGGVVALRVGATDPDGDLLHFSVTGLPPGLSIAPKTGEIFGTPITPGSYSVTLAVGDGKAPDTAASFGWTIEPPAGTAAAAGAAGVRFVKLEELSEVNGKPWGSIAEFNLIGADNANLPRSGWTAIADSFDKNDRPANAIDGSPASFWHSQWDGAEPVPPHRFIVDLGQLTVVRGFRYLPRQDTGTNGMIAKYRFYTSSDGIDWGRPLAEGDFTRQGSAKAEKTVMLK